jgi:glutamate-1-semialdehyde 2,1-aminomutase
MAPLGAVYQAGTLSGNPLAMAAGLATLTRLARPETYEELEQISASLEAGLRRVSDGHPVSLNRVGSMLTLFFTADVVTDYASARRSDLERFGAFFRAALDGGVYLAPSQFETGFVSLAHGPREIDQVVAAAEAFFHQA